MHVFVAKPTYLRPHWSRPAEPNGPSTAIDFTRMRASRPANGIITVGKGASMAGDITNCSKVEIAGTFEGTIDAEILVVRAGAHFKGTATAERAEVHGTIEGRLSVVHHLMIGSNGRIDGELAYGSISVTPGARVAGSVEHVTQRVTVLVERSRALVVTKQAPPPSQIDRVSMRRA